MNEMTFWDHLDVFRGLLFRIIVVWLVLAIGYFIAMPWLFDKVIMAPCHDDFVFYNFIDIHCHHPFVEIYHLIIK